MNRYELTFLLEKEEDSKSINETLKSLSGKIVDEKKWGQRQLAYPIKKHTSAFYFTWIFEIDSKNVSEFKKKLNYDEKIIRHLLLVL